MMAVIDPNREVREVRGTLWPLIPGPTIWALHFLVCYIVAAVYCAKAGLAADLGPARIVIAVATVIALAGIIAAALHAQRIWGGFTLTVDPTNDEDTARDRRHFLGFSALLLCGLSFVATLYVALPALMITTCG